MPIVTLLPSGQSREFAPGTALLSAIRASDANFARKCTDSACTGDCHVFVQEGRKSLSKATREENAQLDAIVGVGTKSRLACRAQLGQDNVSVELLGFASG